MKAFFSIAIVLLFASCGGADSAIHQQLSGTDSLVIQFNKLQTNSIEKVVTTTEIKAIEKITRFVDSKTGKEYKCGYDGNLMFYSKGKLLGDVAFNYSGEDCKHFILSNGGKLTFANMSNEASDFFKSLAEGKEWY